MKVEGLELDCQGIKEVWMDENLCVYLQGMKAYLFLCSLGRFITHKGFNKKLRECDSSEFYIPLFILVYYVEEPTWAWYYWNDIWLRARSHVLTSHWKACNNTNQTSIYNGVAFGWVSRALIVAWSWPLVTVWSSHNLKREARKMELCTNSFLLNCTWDGPTTNLGWVNTMS